jgi:hypothetical protein
MPKCHDVRQFAPIQPRIERLHREPFRTSEEAIDVSPDNLSEASFSKSAQPIRPRRRLLNLSFDEGDRLLHPTRDGRHLSDTSGRGQLRRVQGAIA